MYSTASSECDEHCPYGADVYGYQKSCYGRNPFYPTMGQPLIYYAQVPAPSKKQRSRENRKDNRSCFVKAFQWYTQEHLPNESMPSKKNEMSGFASWLDSKYDEFLRDCQLDSVYNLKIKQASFIEADVISNNTCCERRSKKFRVKSPWRRQRCSSKEAGDVIQKPAQSFQFILPPKDMTRPTSASCQPSNTTVVSNEILTRSAIKSQSYTLVSADGYKPENNADKLNKDDDLENKSLNNDFSCQCSSVKVAKMNAQSQYDTDAERVTPSDNQITLRKMCQPCNKFMPINDIPKPILTTKEFQAKTSASQHAIFCQCCKEQIPNIKSQCQCPEHQAERAGNISKIQSSSVCKICPCETDEEFKVENPAQPPSLNTFAEDSIQTSDHSIHLEKDSELEYPLFMKIVCADKLCK